MLSTFGTISLYILIIASSTIFASLSQKFNRSKIKFRFFFFLLSFFILLVFNVFTDTGPDYENYVSLIERIDWHNYASQYDEEPWFSALLLVLMGITNRSIPLTIAIVKTVTLIIVFLSFFILRKRISLGFSVLAYCGWCYLSSFYLLPMMLAASLVLLANALKEFKKTWFISILLILLAAQFHNSAYLFLAVFVFSWIITPLLGVNKLFNTIVVIAYALALLLSNKIFNFAIQHISFFHYESYGGVTGIGAGLFWLILFAPLFIIVFFSFKFKTNSKTDNKIFLYSMTSGLVGLLAYQFSVIGRLEFLFISLYCVLFSKKIVANVKKRPVNYKFYNFALIAYVLFRGCVYFVDQMNWVDNYSFVNPFL